MKYEYFFESKEYEFESDIQLSFTFIHVLPSDFNGI